jgi:hypothetical protein
MGLCCCDHDLHLLAYNMKHVMQILGVGGLMAALWPRRSSPHPASAIGARMLTFWRYRHALMVERRLWIGRLARAPQRSRACRHSQPALPHIGDRDVDRLGAITADNP